MKGEEKRDESSDLPNYLNIFGNLKRVSQSFPPLRESPPDQPVAVEEAPVFEGAAGRSQRAGF